MRLALTLFLAGCYAPSIATGVPCSADGKCPRDQMCVPTPTGSFCGIPAPDDGPRPDVPVDVAAINDRDNDGIDDSVDDCPDLADPGQANEDGDKFGDACDPCPIFKNDAPVDPDTDGVSDSCDPNPNTPGDQIVLFEGFSGGIPTTWVKAGTWSGGNGEAALQVAGDARAYLSPPLAAPLRATVSTVFTITGVAGAVPDLDISYPFVPTANAGSNDGEGVECDLYDRPGSGHKVSLYLRHALDDFAVADFPWAANTPTALAERRSADSYTCVALTGQPPTVVQGTQGTSLQAPIVALASKGISAKFQWLMIVTSPP